jgi:predicted transcriptional regulator
MRYTARENKIKKNAKRPSQNAKSASIAENKEANGTMKSGRMFSQSSSGQSSGLGYNAAADEGEDFSILTLKYEINERGIGKILLPPSLSTLLQSDRVSISPSAGGLFIRSI